MRIIVCVKQVPNTNQIKINPETGTLIRDGVPSILNYDDANALEQALAIKDAHPGTEVIALTMGPPQAKEMLQECLAMGADDAILLSDRALGGSDTWATSNALAAGIKKIGDYDLIFAGRQAIDGDTAQVGPQIAEKLGLPQVTYVKEFQLEEEAVIVKRALEDGYEKLKLTLPCVLTAIKELNVPRYMSVPGILKAAKTQVKVWSAQDIGVDQSVVGLKASPTNVFRSFTPKPKGAGMAVDGDTPRELAENLLTELRKKHII
ncbi:electron transfer flavoprotein subunit beta [Ihubacter massiliensis]|uniref:Electron transfer flavoprotein small subunit n=1 Tax=Hominibacterium faecale TaxID=2839743 RepID=A0A9J6QRT8_9FIRM|nr:MULTISPECIES: electron transfer flavoprotein subunit beta [Eubacteriales Family XIII. Incertae Sedis]MCO7122991.1 electron transfer flavoprotein subunit beta [Ihubacter massiliensis]MCU7377251.1 electron transfer flavoprotein subunit beta [Hominibacterium faecale]